MQIHEIDITKKNNKMYGKNNKCQNDFYSFLQTYYYYM